MNLRVAGKLAVFGAAAVALSLGLAGMRAAADRADVEVARQELRGAEVVEALLRVFQRVAEHRGLAAQLLSGRAEVRPQVAQKQREAQEALDALMELDRRHGRYLATTSSVEQLRGAWQSMVAGLDSKRPEESFQQHTALISQVLDLIWRVGVASGIRKASGSLPSLSAQRVPELLQEGHGGGYGVLVFLQEPV